MYPVLLVESLQVVMVLSTTGTPELTQHICKYNYSVITDDLPVVVYFSARLESNAS